MSPTTTPPVTPDIIPDITGAPEPMAIPIHKGKATRNTTKDAGKSAFKVFIFN
jgi:hypothetical protein